MQAFGSAEGDAFVVVIDAQGGEAGVAGAVVRNSPRPQPRSSTGAEPRSAGRSGVGGRECLLPVRELFGESQPVDFDGRFCSEGAAAGGFARTSGGLPSVHCG